MDKDQSTCAECVSSVQINGTMVRLVFAPEGNKEAIAVVRDILKGAYLRSQNVSS